MLIWLLYAMVVIASLILALFIISHHLCGMTGRDFQIMLFVDMPKLLVLFSKLTQFLRLLAKYLHFPQLLALEFKQSFRPLRK